MTQTTTAGLHLLQSQEDKLINRIEILEKPPKRYIRSEHFSKTLIDFRLFQLNFLNEELRLLRYERDELTLEFAPELALLRERKFAIERERRIRITEAYVVNLASEYSGDVRPQIEDIFMNWSVEDDVDFSLDKSRQELQKLMRRIDAFKSDGFTNEWAI